jgi:hypothetical protein
LGKQDLTLNKIGSFDLKLNEIIQKAVQEIISGLFGGRA